MDNQKQEGLSEENTQEESQVEIYDSLVSVAERQIDVAEKYKKPRLDTILKIEDSYFGKIKKKLKGRFNVPLPILSGFVDTLMAKIDNPPFLSFKNTTQADLKKAKKIEAAWQHESSSTKENWAKKDRLAKKMAIFSGRAILKYFSSSDPEYSSTLEVVDYNDFLCEPGGGSDLENHLFCGQRNIFKTKEDLKKGVENGVYNAKQVEKLINNVGEEDTKEIQGEAEERFNRARSLNLDPQNNNYTGSTLFSLTEWYMSYEGKRYYLLFDERSRIWVRGEPLEELFSSEEYPYVSWATHEDPLNFWSKSPCDDIYPVSEAMRVVFNQALDNLQKKNWLMRAYDSDIFPDPSRLEWRPDGLVPANATSDKPVSQGIYEFKVDDATQLTVNLTQFLDNFLGQKSGITPAAQGMGDSDAKVGVYYGQMQQVADRLGLINKSYTEAWAALGQKYVEGLKDNMPQKIAVKILGEEGVEWEELIKEDLNAEYDINVVGGNAQLEEDEVKKKKQGEALRAITSNPALMQSVSPSWVLENLLRFGEFTEEEIRVAMDTNSEGDRIIISEAADENEKIIKGKEVNPNRGATTAHIQKHIDYAYDTKLGMDNFKKIMQHAQSEIPFAQANAIRKAKQTLVGQGQSPAQANPAQKGMQFNKGLEVPEQIPGTPGGTQARSQQRSQISSPGQEPVQGPGGPLNEANQQI